MSEGISSANLIFIKFEGDKVHEKIKAGNTKRFGSESDKYITCHSVQPLSGPLTLEESQRAGIAMHGYSLDIIIKCRSDDQHSIATSLEPAFELMCNDRVKADKLRVVHGRNISADKGASTEKDDSYGDVLFMSVTSLGDDFISLRVIANSKEKSITKIVDGKVGEVEKFVFESADTLASG
jgi:hypothetical protein